MGYKITLGYILQYVYVSVWNVHCWGNQVGDMANQGRTPDRLREGKDSICPWVVFPILFVIIFTFFGHSLSLADGTLKSAWLLMRQWCTTGLLKLKKGVAHEFAPGGLTPLPSLWPRLRATPLGPRTTPPPAKPSTSLTNRLTSGAVLQRMLRGLWNRQQRRHPSWRSQGSQLLRGYPSRESRSYLGYTSLGLLSSQERGQPTRSARWWGGGQAAGQSFHPLQMLKTFPWTRNWAKSCPGSTERQTFGHCFEGGNVVTIAILLVVISVFFLDAEGLNQPNLRNIWTHGRCWHINSLVTLHLQTEPIIRPILAKGFSMMLVLCVCVCVNVT